MNLKIPKFATQTQIGVVSLIIIAILLTIGHQGYNHYQPGFVYLVTVNGQEVGIVRDQDDLTNIIDHLTDQEKQRTGYDVLIVEEISTKREFQFQPNIHLPNLQYSIDSLVNYEASATLILVENEPTVIVESLDLAKQIIQDVTEYYTSFIKGKIVDQPKVLNDISFENVLVKPEEIVDFESAKSLLLRGTTNFETYKVSRGDSLWNIATKANISVEELKEANNLKTNVVNEGQELKLTTAEPLIVVEIVEEVSVQESIPFTTEWKNNSSLFYWQTRVITPGVNGIKETKYQVTKINGEEVEKVKIGTEVISEPVTRIAERGTSKQSNAAVGRFRWPLASGAGQITSPFGNRNDPFSGRIAFHTGVDIGAPAGTAVYASEGGTVRIAGRQGSYGNLVVIQHSGGYATYYAHLSSINTSVGSTVSKGQLIGRVGRTGSATGNHLHFEIRTGYGAGNGNPVNPMGFFSP
ncbi:M23 family metallopeptidase [Alkalicella caledoniensis]|uniref:M23 family metallopeptidase n=1 Tax=Alkalicella caledoniensis TaxID=2731377 RepID=A0A7G9W8M3_ALKCA|nr:M23 family metallopeptidase [Alkalicella caledoniensis]QNO15035.1 M23 family metallopeptidase [Alkalicella caledoniensis]